MADRSGWDSTTRHSAGSGQEPPGGGGLFAGRYRLIRKLGSGGFGEVYEARDEQFGQRLALKQLKAAVPPAVRAMPEFSLFQDLSEGRDPAPALDALARQARGDVNEMLFLPAACLLAAESAARNGDTTQARSLAKKALRAKAIGFPAARAKQLAEGRP